MNFTRFAIVLCTALLALPAAPAFAWNRLEATRFATLPAGTTHPEGITADARGNLSDGLIIDAADNLWVAANQADEIVVVDPTGRVIAKLGDFDGIDRHGAPVGLMFPASLVRVDDFIYVTNLALDLRNFGLPQAVDSQWAAQVTRYTIARIHAHLPPVRGL